jgi:FAD-linked sulfhydryl oxidase
MHFDPTVWGPHYWFFLHTIAESYPLTPNATTKRKYYDLIQNMPLFIPNPNIGNKFSEYLDKYPVTPYLDNRDSFVRWVHFIHNKFNVLLGKQEISLPFALEKYRAQYKPKPLVFSEKINVRKHVIHAILIVVLLFLIYLYW